MRLTSSAHMGCLRWSDDLPPTPQPIHLVVECLGGLVNSLEGSSFLACLVSQYNISLPHVNEGQVGRLVIVTPMNGINGSANLYGALLELCRITHKRSLGVAI